MSWRSSHSKGSSPPPPPPPSARVPLELDDEQPASNSGRGTDDALRVTMILEDANITCCLVGISALIFYGAGRLRPVCRGTDFYFILVPSNDIHIVCEPSNLTRSLRGPPYTKLDVFIQSCLDTGDRLQLCDVIDGTDLPEQWEWAQDANKRGREFANGKFAHWAPFAKGGKMKKRDMWQFLVRSKKDRLDWTKPSDIFITQYRF
ncbi:hypothetical protein F5Y09DRAFT_331470 [Xylaria sp. FL1042]|nr:hypothetical protein F5Y09DRAFT_331470 [Xylaria sp. FL1042]